MAFSLGTAEGRIVVDGSAAKAGFATAQSAAEAMFSVLENKVNAVKDLGTNMTKIGAVGAAGFGLAVNAAANFEQRMSAVAAVSGATTSEFDALRQKALDLGKDTSFGATEAAMAIEELVKAGLTIPDVMNGAADATVALAAAGEISLPQAAEIASAAMNNFNLTGAEMPRIADLIAGAANASAISVGEFGISLQQVGAVANLTGMDFQDVSVAIAEMGNAGIKGSDAGTSLKTMLMNLQPTTKAQTAEFERLGLLTTSTEGALKSMAEQGIKPVGTSMDSIRQAVGKYLVETQGLKEDTKELGQATDDWLVKNGGMQNAFFDTEGKIKSLKDIQQVLQDSTKGMSEQQKLASLELLFGADAIRAAAIMAKNGASGYDTLYASMSKVTAAEVAATRMDNFRGALEQVKGAIETVAIEVGGVLLPVFTTIAQKIDALISKFLELPEGIKKAIYIFAAVVTAVTLAGGALIGLAFAIAPVVASFLGMLALNSVISIFTAIFAAAAGGAGPLAALGAGVARIMTLFGRVTTVARILIGVLRLMGAAWAIATGPIGIAIAIIAALAAGFYILYQRSETFRNFVNGIAAAIMGVLNPAIELAKQAIQSIVDGFNGVSGSGALGFFEGIGQVARTLWDTLMSLVSWFMGNFMPALSAAGASIQSSLGAAFQQISSVVTGQLWPALQQLWTSLSTTLAPVVQFLGEHWQIFAAILLGPVILALGLIIGAVIAVVAVLATILPPIIQIGAAIINFAVGIIGPVFSTIVSVVSGAINILVGIIRTFAALLTGNWSAAWEGLKQIAEGAWQAITGVFTGVGDIIGAIVAFCDAVIQVFIDLWDELVGHSIVPDTINGVIEWFAKLPGEILGKLAAFAAQVIAKFVEIAINVITKIAQLVADIVNWFSQLPGRVISALAALGGMLLSTAASWIASAISGVSGALGGLLSIFSGLGSRVLGALGNVGSILYNAGSSIIRGLINGINSAIGGVRSALGKVTSMIPSWKGPPEKDKILLTNAGKLIMAGLVKGIDLGTPELKKTLNNLMPVMQSSVSLEASGYRPSTTVVKLPAAVGSSSTGGNTYNFNSYGADANAASDVTARKIRTMVTMGAFG